MDNLWDLKIEWKEVYQEVLKANGDESQAIEAVLYIDLLDDSDEDESFEH